jgi:DNA-binding MarR family transcriptional regulator
MSRVYLTEMGRSLRGGLEESWREFDRLTFAGLDDQEIEQLQAYLQHIIGNLEASGEASGASVDDES